MHRPLPARLAALCALACWSAPIPALDLLDAYRQALTHDARFAAARATHEAGLEKRSQGRAQLLPTLGLSGTATRYDAEITYDGATTFEGGARRYTRDEYELRLTQPLYRKQNLAAWREGKAQAALAESEYAVTRQELILRVAQVYFDVLAADDNLALAAAQKSVYLTQHDQAKARLEAGVAPITEMHEAKARADLAAAQEIAAGSEVAVRRRSFWKVTGMEAAGLSVLDARAALHTPNPDKPDDWIEKARMQNPDLQAVRENLRVAEQALEAAKAGHHPTLDLVAGYTATQDTGSVYTSAHSDSEWKSAGVQLQVPLYQGGYVNSRVREAAANRDRAREEIEDAARELTVRTEQAFLAVNDGLKRAEALREAVYSSKQALEATRAGLSAGTRNLVDVLNATQQLYGARRDHARARYDYLLGLLRLEAAAGQLSEEDVVTVNVMLGR